MGWSKKKDVVAVDEQPTRDAYGFVVKPEHASKYAANAPLYVSEESERADRWDGFLERGRDGSIRTPEKRASHRARVRSGDDAESSDASSASDDGDDGRSSEPRDIAADTDVWGRHSLAAVVAILDGRAPGGTKPDAPSRERELQALVRGGVPMALRGSLWQLFAGVQHRRRAGLYERMLADAGETPPRGSSPASAAGRGDDSEGTALDDDDDDELDAANESAREDVEIRNAVKTLVCDALKRVEEEEEARVASGSAATTTKGAAAAAAPAAAKEKEREADDNAEDGPETPPPTPPRDPTTRIGATDRPAAIDSDEEEDAPDDDADDGAADAPPLPRGKPSRGAPETSPETFAAIVDQVDKDLSRTFPAHPLLDGIGRDALRRVLLAYALHNPAVGYCQGMNFLAALLLLLMEEEAAFWCLASIVEDILPGYFTSSMLASAVDQAVLRTFVDQKFPSVSNAIDACGTPLGAVTGSWFLTLFVNHLPWECALRVWDVLLFERTRAISFQIALALIDANSQRLLESAKPENDNLMETFATLAPGAFDGSALLAVATSGHDDITWEKVMHEYKTQHRKLTRAIGDGRMRSFASSPKTQAGSNRAWGEAVPLPRLSGPPPTPTRAACEKENADAADADAEMKSSREFEAWFSPAVSGPNCTPVSRAKVYGGGGKASAASKRATTTTATTTATFLRDDAAGAAAAKTKKKKTAIASKGAGAETGAMPPPAAVAPSTSSSAPPPPPPVGDDDAARELSFGAAAASVSDGSDRPRDSLDAADDEVSSKTPDGAAEKKSSPKRPVPPAKKKSSWWSWSTKEKPAAAAAATTTATTPKKAKSPSKKASSKPPPDPPTVVALEILIDAEGTGVAAAMRDKLARVNAALANAKAELDETSERLAARELQLDSSVAACAALADELNDRDAQLEQRDAALRERESALREKSEALEEAEASASAARREADALRAELTSLRDVTIASGEGQGSDSELFDVPLLLDQDQDQDQSAVVEDEEAEEVGEAGGEEA